MTNKNQLQNGKYFILNSLSIYSKKYIFQIKSFLCSILSDSPLVHMNPVHGPTKILKGSISLCILLVYFYHMASPFSLAPSIASEPYFDLDVFRMPPTTNGQRVIFLVMFLLQWELHGQMHPCALLLLLDQELLLALPCVKQIMDLIVFF